MMSPKANPSYGLRRSGKLTQGRCRDTLKSSTENEGGASRGGAHGGTLPEKFDPWQDILMEQAENARGARPTYYGRGRPGAGDCEGDRNGARREDWDRERGGEGDAGVVQDPAGNVRVTRKKN